MVSRRPTTWISPATVESANMKARVRASVSWGSFCMLRVARESTQLTRSAGVSPGIGLRPRVASVSSNWRASAETSRWILEGK